jgi:hypothetical protein
MVPHPANGHWIRSLFTATRLLVDFRSSVMVPCQSVVYGNSHYLVKQEIELPDRALGEESTETQAGIGFDTHSALHFSMVIEE